MQHLLQQQPQEAVQSITREQDSRCRVPFDRLQVLRPTVLLLEHHPFIWGLQILLAWICLLMLIKWPHRRHPLLTTTGGRIRTTGTLAIKDAESGLLCKKGILFVKHLTKRHNHLHLLNPFFSFCLLVLKIRESSPVWGVTRISHDTAYCECLRNLNASTSTQQAFVAQGQFDEEKHAAQAMFRKWNEMKEQTRTLFCWCLSSYFILLSKKKMHS